MSEKVFAAAEQIVVDGAGCTWCGASAGEVCAERDRKGGLAHAARWRDYWNTWHDAPERRSVYVAPWRKMSP